MRLTRTSSDYKGDTSAALLEVLDRTETADLWIII